MARAPTAKTTAMVITFPATDPAAIVQEHYVRTEFVRRCDSSHSLTSTRSTYNCCSSAAFTSSFNPHRDSLALIFLPCYPTASLLTYSITPTGAPLAIPKLMQSLSIAQGKSPLPRPPSQHSHSFPVPLTPRSCPRSPANHAPAPPIPFESYFRLFQKTGWR